MSFLCLNTSVLPLSFFRIKTEFLIMAPKRDFPLPSTHQQLHPTPIPPYTSRSTNPACLQHSERKNVQCSKPSSLVIDYNSWRQLARTEIFVHILFSAVPRLPALCVTWEKSEVRWLSNCPALASYLTFLPGGSENFFFKV